MSFSGQPPPPPPFVQMPFAGGDNGGFWPDELRESYSQYENAPPFKRLRNSDNISPNSRVNPPNLPGQKGTSHIFYKTRMCAKFMEGTCRNGELCSFAHGVGDLREPPPNWQELIRDKDIRGGAGNWNDDQKMIHRMKICKKFFNGEECPYGDKCTFLHERPPRSKTDVILRHRESSAISIGTMGTRSDAELIEISKNGIEDSDAGRIKPVYWKTRMCSKWETTGACPFADRCHFAHGYSELQVAPTGRIESEMIPNSVPITPKPISVPLVELSSPDAMADPLAQEKEEKKISKWKLTKKMNRIYADWIDDLLPPHLLHTNADS